MSGGADELIELIRQGRKVEAVRLLRERTGMGLAAAADAVARIRTLADAEAALAGAATPDAGSKAAPPHTPSRAAVNDPEVIALARAGRRIAAIKRLRQISGMSLKEAKQAVDARFALEGRPSSLSGKLTVVAIVILLAVLAAAIVRGLS